MMTESAKNGESSEPHISGALHVDCTDLEARYDALLNAPDVPANLKKVFLRHRREAQKRYESIRAEWWKKNWLMRILHRRDNHDKRCRHEREQITRAHNLFERDQAVHLNTTFPPCPHRIIPSGYPPFGTGGGSWYLCTHGRWNGDCGYAHASGCWMCTHYTEKRVPDKSHCDKTHCSLGLKCPGAYIDGPALALSTCPAYIPAQVLALVKNETFSLLNQKNTRDVKMNSALVSSQS